MAATSRYSAPAGGGRAAADTRRSVEDAPGSDARYSSAGGDGRVSGGRGGAPGFGGQAGARGPDRRAGARGFGGRAGGGVHGEVASSLPLAVGGGAFVVSLVLAVIELADARASDLGVVTLPVIEPRLWWVALLGYVLTPIVVIVASGLDRLWQRNGLRDRRFSPRPAYGRVSTWLVRVGFVLALWHIVNLAAAISDFWSTS